MRQSIQGTCWRQIDRLISRRMKKGPKQTSVKNRKQKQINVKRQAMANTHEVALTYVFPKEAKKRSISLFHHRRFRFETRTIQIR